MNIMLEPLSTFLPHETEDHMKWKYYWFQKLTKQGFKCEFEKTLINPVTKERLIVDVYGEKETEIAIVEVIHSSWNGKNPHPFISKRKQKHKKIHFIKQKTLTGKGIIKNTHKLTYSSSSTISGFTTRKLIESGGSYLISLPKSWIVHKIRTGLLKKIEKKGEERYYLELHYNENGDIIFSIPKNND